MSYKNRLLLAICLGGLCFTGLSASVNTITVTNTNDSGPGSLRQTLADASDNDTIDFDSSLNGQFITLTTAELAVDKNITISGPDANLLVVSRDPTAPSFRIFHVMPGHTVTIKGLTIQNGDADEGGGILNDQATLTVAACSVINNAAPGGGGIASDGGSLTVMNSTVSGNSAVADFPFTFGYGGGISGDGTIVNSTISGNYSGLTAGGIGGSGTIINSTISNNGAGGGKNNFPGQAGGIDGTWTIINSTISGNSVFGSQLKGPGLGGGIYAYGTVTISNSTFSGNYIIYFGNGGNICNNGTLEIKNTILNRLNPWDNIFNNAGTITSAGYNVSDDDGGGYLNGPGDQINTDPLLGPLQNNGGPTSTHALLPGSSAINAGNPNFTPPPSTDQRGRGFLRVFDGRLDIGSFEVQPTPRPSPTPRPRPTPLFRPTPSQ